MKSKSVLSCAFALVLALGTGAAQESNGTRILFHVTSVRQENAPNDCPAADCEATRFTVEGYAEVRHDGALIDLVLRCSEILVGKPSPHYAVTCGRVHAHNDYDATLYADTIYFADGPKKKPEGAPPEALYRIMSEKEADKKTR